MNPNLCSSRGWFPWAVMVVLPTIDIDLLAFSSAIECFFPLFLLNLRVGLQPYGHLRKKLFTVWSFVSTRGGWKYDGLLRHPKGSNISMNLWGNHVSTSVWLGKVASATMGTEKKASTLWFVFFLGWVGGHTPGNLRQDTQHSHIWNEIHFLNPSCWGIYIVRFPRHWAFVRTRRLLAWFGSNQIVPLWGTR